MMKARSSLPETAVSMGDGSTVGCYLSGSGESNFMLLHGLNSYSGTWKKNVGMFESLGRVCAPTLPRVQVNTGELFREAVVTLSGDVLAIMRRLAFRTATIAGSSLGGLIGMYLAVFHPKSVDRLILVDSALPWLAATPEGLAGKLLDPRSIEQPVLIVWGERDTIIPMASGQLLHDSIADSRFEVIRGAGHIPHLQKPEEFNRLVTEFIRDTPGKGTRAE